MKPLLWTVFTIILLIVMKRIIDFYLERHYALKRELRDRLHRENVLRQRAELGLPPPCITAEQAEQITFDYAIQHGFMRIEAYKKLQQAAQNGALYFEVREEPNYWYLHTLRRGGGEMAAKVDNQNGSMIEFYKNRTA